jgi:hypothetical protein
MAAVRHKLDSSHRSVRNAHLLKRSTLYSISCCAIPKICNPAGLLHQIATAHTRQSVRTENFSILFSRMERTVDPKEYTHLQIAGLTSKRKNKSKQGRRETAREGGEKTSQSELRTSPYLRKNWEKIRS